jgi:hypothetical protein
MNPQGWKGGRGPRAFTIFPVLKNMILDYCSKNQESMSSKSVATEINQTLLPKCYEIFATKTLEMKVPRVTTHIHRGSCHVVLDYCVSQDSMALATVVFGIQVQ